MAELQEFCPLIDKWSGVFFSGPVKLFTSLIGRVLNCKNSPQLRGITLRFGFYCLLWRTPPSSRRAARQSARACQSPGKAWKTNDIYAGRSKIS